MNASADHCLLFSDVLLDDSKVLEDLSHLLTVSRYFVPKLIVLMGNFTSRPYGNVKGDFIKLARKFGCRMHLALANHCSNAELFGELGDVLCEHSNIVEVALTLAFLLTKNPLIVIGFFHHQSIVLVSYCTQYSLRAGNSVRVDSWPERRWVRQRAAASRPAAPPDAAAAGAPGGSRRQIHTGQQPVSHPLLLHRDRPLQGQPPT